MGVMIVCVLLILVSREPVWCVRPLRLRVGGVRWRDCRLEPSWWCGCRGRPRRRALLLPVGSEYRLLICNVIRAAPMLRSGVLGRRGPGRDPLLPCGMADTTSLEQKSNRGDEGPTASGSCWSAMASATRGRQCMCGKYHGTHAHRTQDSVHNV